MKTRFIIKQGDVFGRLTVISSEQYYKPGKYKRPCVDLVCLCGNKSIAIRSDLLLRGKVKSCGCLANEIERKLEKHYGRLTVISEQYKKKGVPSRMKYVDVLCECGTIKSVRTTSLKVGTTVSCGCYCAEQTTRRFTKHGLTKHRLHEVWCNMIARCYCEYGSGYNGYGALGVRVCDEWRNDFKPFYDWCMANGWNESMQIDKDIKAKALGIPALLYSPELCSIVTPKENLRHSSIIKLSVDIAAEIRSVVITSRFDVKRLATKYGVSVSCIYAVLKNETWT